MPCPPSRDLPNPGMEPRSPALQVDSLPSELQGSPFASSIPSLNARAPQSLTWPFSFISLYSSPFNHLIDSILLCILLGFNLTYSGYWGFLGDAGSKEPACQCRRRKEMWVQSLGWEDPLEEGMAIHSSILAWRILKDRGVWWATVNGVANNWT